MQPLQMGSAIVALATRNTLVAGVSRTGTLELVELLPDGRLDPGYGDGGVVLPPITLQPWGLLALPDGKLLVIGPAQSPLAGRGPIYKFPDWQLVRLLPDGRPDLTFGHGGLVDVSGVQVFDGRGDAGAELAPNGDIVLPTVIGGNDPSRWLPALVRLSPDGSPDPTFGTQGVLQLPGGLGAYVQSFSVRPDGSIVVAVRASGPPRSLLLRLTAAGGLDPSFAGGSPATLTPHVGNMLVGADGGIVLLTYEASTVSDSKLVRYAADGTADPTFGTGGATDLGPGHNFNRLFAAADRILLVSLGIPGSIGPVGSREQIVRLTATGQVDPTLGGPTGLSVGLPFGGGSYRSDAIANLSQNSFEPFGVIQRTDGTLLVYGMVQATEVRITEFPGTEPSGEVAGLASGFALAALNSSFALDSSFGGASSLRLRARISSTRLLAASGIAVRLRSSGAALCVVTASSGGQTIGRVTVPFLTKAPSYSADQVTTLRTVRIPLTRAGRLLLRRKRRLRVVLRAAAVDLAGNHVAVRTSAVLAG